MRKLITTFSICIIWFLFNLSAIAWMPLPSVGGGGGSPAASCTTSNHSELHDLYGGTWNDGSAISSEGGYSSKFTTPAGSGQTITMIRAQMGDVLDAADTAIVSIYSHDSGGDTPDQQLASKTRSDITVDTQYDFELASTYDLAASTTYWVVIRADNDIEVIYDNIASTRECDCTANCTTAGSETWGTCYDDYQYEVAVWGCNK